MLSISVSFEGVILVALVMREKKDAALRWLINWGSGLTWTSTTLLHWMESRRRVFHHIHSVKMHNVHFQLLYVQKMKRQLRVSGDQSITWTSCWLAEKTSRQHWGQGACPHLHHCWRCNSHLWRLVCSEDLRENTVLVPELELTQKQSERQTSLPSSTSWFIDVVVAVVMMDVSSTTNRRNWMKGASTDRQTDRHSIVVLLPAQSRCWSGRPRWIPTPHRWGPPPPPHLDTCQLLIDGQTKHY